MNTEKNGEIDEIIEDQAIHATQSVVHKLSSLGKLMGRIIPWLNFPSSSCEGIPWKP
jgi:hypothetical protein